MQEKGLFDIDTYLSEDCFEHYNKYGWVLLKNFLKPETDLIPIQKYINHLVSLKLKEAGEETKYDSNISDFQIEDFLRLCNIDRSKGGEIYNACRHIYPLINLSIKEEFIKLGKLLMKTDYINLIPYTAMRIDLKGEEKYLFPWHQDYPYTQGSIDGIVFWIPFHDVKKEDGAVKIIPGSHRNGLQKVKLIDPYNSDRNGAKSISLCNEREYDKMDSVSLDVMYSDVLVFNTLLVHKSTELSKSKCKLATQIRYANFNNPDAIKRGWPRGMIEGNNFEFDHPEFVET